MMKNNIFNIRMNRQGELVQDYLHDFTREKYKADSPFLWGPVPFLLMAVCVIIDVAFFRSLFVRISYDNPAMIVLEVAGLAFAADVVAAYAGILGKRLRQGLSTDIFNFYLLAAVPVLALIVNGMLRVATMPLMSMDGSVDAAAKALTIIAIVVPVFTSIGNFAISFQTYDPLGSAMCREEMALDEINDLCRRLAAMKEECDSFSKERLIEMDGRHLVNAKKKVINDAMIRYADMKVRLMEYLKNPTATNVLSKSQCDEIFSRIDQELKTLENTVVLQETAVEYGNDHVISFSDKRRIGGK